MYIIDTNSEKQQDIMRKAYCRYINESGDCMIYSYTTSLKADSVLFNQTCYIIENSIDGIVKSEPLIDVDGSILQKYTVGSKQIIVQNDFEVDAVYIDSDIDLQNHLNNLCIISFTVP